MAGRVLYFAFVAEGKKDGPSTSSGQTAREQGRVL